MILWLGIGRNVMSDDLSILNNNMKTLISINRDLRQDITKAQHELALIQQLMIGLIVVFLILVVFIVSAPGGADKKPKEDKLTPTSTNAPMGSPTPTSSPSFPPSNMNHPAPISSSVNTPPANTSPQMPDSQTMMNNPSVNNNVMPNQPPSMPNQPINAPMPNPQQYR